MVVALFPNGNDYNSPCPAVSTCASLCIPLNVLFHMQLLLTVPVCQCIPQALLSMRRLELSLSAVSDQRSNALEKSQLLIDEVGVELHACLISFYILC